MKLDISHFRQAALDSRDKTVWTDNELLQQIEVLQCLVAYFNARKERLVGFALMMELHSLESMALARGWEFQADDTWKVKKRA